MSTVLLPLVEDEVLPVPVNVTSEPATLGAPGRVSTSRRPWGPCLLIAGLIGSVALVSAWNNVWQARQATRASSILAAKDVWTEAQITTLDPQSMGLVTGDGQQWVFGLNFNDTSVFQQGGVLNITHLRRGQQVMVLSKTQGGQAMAKSIEIKPLSETGVIPALVVGRYVM